MYISCLSPKSYLHEKRIQQNLKRWHQQNEVLLNISTAYKEFNLRDDIQSCSLKIIEEFDRQNNNSQGVFEFHNQQLSDVAWQK